MKTLPLFLALAATLHAAPPEPKFRAVTIDDKIQIGYGVAVADVDGDKLPDILLADKKQFVWYRNPGAEKSGDPAAWAKFLIAENLTKNDNVCLAAQDIDGDGKCEIAVGAEWNPGDTVNSGAVFYLIPPEDRTQKWEPVKFPNVEPTTHRMKWIKLNDGTSGLVVVPLHGRGNKNGEGDGIRVLLYQPPRVRDPSSSDWKAQVLFEVSYGGGLHMSHNLDVAIDGNGRNSFILAAKEGLFTCWQPDADWQVNDIFIGTKLYERWSRIPNRATFSVIDEFKGAGEVRWGQLNPDEKFIAAVEPMHGNALTYYRPYALGGPVRNVLTERMSEGHALACGDLLGAGSDQIVVGWRGTPGKEGSTFGVHVWTPLDPEGKKWRDSAVDDGGMACEDLVLADLNGDGKLDIAASGRATHNVKVYFNETPR